MSSYLKVSLLALCGFGCIDASQSLSRSSSSGSLPTESLRAGRSSTEPGSSCDQDERRLLETTNFKLEQELMEFRYQDHKRFRPQQLEAEKKLEQELSHLRSMQDARLQQRTNGASLSSSSSSSASSSSQSATPHRRSFSRLVLSPSNYFFRGSLQPSRNTNHSAISQSHEYKVNLTDDQIEEIRKECPEVVTEIINTINLLKRKNAINNRLMPKKVLLVGPPGNGKTTLAGFIAHECNMSCSVFKASVIADQYQNSGDENIEKIFLDAIENRAPRVILIDDLQGLIKKDKGPKNFDTGMITTLWGALDECNKSPILFVGALNFFEDMPESFLSQQDDVIRIESPDKLKRQRFLEYLKIQHLKQKMPVNFDAVSLSMVAKETYEFSMRNLENLMGKAIRNAVPRGTNPIAVTTKDFLDTSPEIKNRQELVRGPAK